MNGLLQYFLNGIKLDLILIVIAIVFVIGYYTVKMITNGKTK